MISDSNNTLPESSEAIGGGKPRFVRLPLRSRLDLEFLLHAIKGLRPFQYSLAAPADSKSNLSKQYFGCCLAVPADLEELKQILELVRELGVGSVRLDLTYDQDVSLAEALVDALRQEEADVLLHLVQPKRSAATMHKQTSAEEWKQFVRSNLERFSNKLVGVEVGTTINRASWSGYQLSGFLVAWQIAHDLCKSSSVPLIGPNVTDFEPQYNAGILGMLNRRKQLPDIHSNNLFAERAIEPENVDHKIMGYALRQLHGFDLKKKIALIAAIAARYGLRRNWSTCAFWTIPRVARQSSDPEAQLADYLVRYYILCASSGHFERIFWGPLVSYREGLLDDGTEDRSISDGLECDIVALYKNYPGSFGDWRKRPAFHALKGLSSQLSGYRHTATECTGRGLEIHRFIRGSETCMVAWTTNRRLARLTDCFDQSSIEALSSVFNSIGSEDSDLTGTISQSPSFFHWKNGGKPNVLSTAACIKGAVVTPISEQRYYAFESNNWRGIILASSREEATQLNEGLNPDAIAGRKERKTLRKSRNAIWAVEDPRDTSKNLVVKQPLHIAWHKQILDRNKPSKALRSWNGTIELMHRDIGTAAAIAFYESTDPTQILENWFICEDVADAISVRQYFTAYASGNQSHCEMSFEDFCEQLIPYVLKMHRKRVYFRDLAGGNVLVQQPKQGDGRLRFSLIDTARLRCISSGLKIHHVCDDLKRLTHKLDAEKQRLFVNAYLSELDATFGIKQRIFFKLYGMKTYLKGLKRSVRRKFKN